MVKILTAEYLTSAPSLKECPTWTLPEIAMVGRSNVGKSSLINTLVGRKNLARTSNTPGKTRLINFYPINNRFAFVDLPGYGYAKVSKAEQAKWQKNLEAYLKERENLALIIQLIDARHGPQPNDEQMLEWLQANEMPVAMILTKVDKISRNILARQVQQTASKLNLSTDQIIPFSAETGLGKDALWQFLTKHLAGQGTKI